MSLDLIDNYTPKYERDPSIDQAPVPAPEIAVSSERILALVSLLSVLTAQDERILRMIASMFYKFEVCYATHVQLAKAAGVAKSTLQASLDRLEALELLIIVRRRQTSNVTYLAEGVREALHKLKLDRILADLSATRLENPAMTRESFPSLNRPKALPKKQPSVRSYSTKQNHQQTRNVRAKKKNREDKLACSVLPEKQEKADPVEHTSNSNPLLEELVNLGVVRAEARKLVEDVPASRIKNHLNAKLFEKAKNPPGFLIAAIRGDWDIPEKSAQTHTTISPIIAELVAIGVSPSAAATTAKFWPTDRIQRQILLGEHITKDNPGGWILEAIRCDIASKRALPGSEHAEVLKRDARFAPLPISRINQPPTTSRQRHEPIQTPVNTLKLAFAALSETCREQYMNQAREALLAKPTGPAEKYIQRGEIDHPAVRAAIRAQSLHIFEASNP